MPNSEAIADVLVVGAGIAGLRCARRLADAGYQVLVLEKSRGVGGRVATRRLHNTYVDHGTCYLSPQEESFQRFLSELVELGLVQMWTEKVYEIDVDGALKAPSPENVYPRWIAPMGMTAIAKVLTPGLDIRFSHQVESITLSEAGWLLAATVTTPESLTVAEFEVKALVIAIPAPQVVPLLEPLKEQVSATFLEQIAAIEFLPCLSVMAGYSQTCLADWFKHFPQVKAVTFADHSLLGWLGLDSSKRVEAPQPIFVLQSSATFAQQHLDSSDLQPAAEAMLTAAADRFLPWLTTPQWLQVHRWRYAFAKNPLREEFLAAPTAFPLLCAGDWTSGKKVENAFNSGLAAATYLLKQKVF
jgi:hypothetical protein